MQTHATIKYSSRHFYLIKFIYKTESETQSFLVCVLFVSSPFCFLPSFTCTFFYMKETEWD